MPYFAQIQNNEVLRVIVADDIAWCQSRLGGTWIETSYTASQRGNYAGIGYRYLSEHDLFMPPQPVYNFDLDTQQASWVFPDGDHIYVPIATDSAEYLSRALYGLIVPGGDGLYCGIIPHTTRPEVVALQLRSSDMIPIALGADPTPLALVLQPFVDMGNLTELELQILVGGIQAMAGQSITVADFIPASWQPYVMTDEQAVEQGYAIR
jgi:hypothetical protein